MAIQIQTALLDIGEDDQQPARGYEGSGSLAGDGGTGVELRVGKKIKGPQRQGSTIWYSLLGISVNPALLI